MLKKVFFIVLIFLIFLNNFSFLEAFENLNLNETKELKVSYEKLILSFTPEKDGRYEFLVETKPLDTNESFIKKNINVEVEIYDSNEKLLSTNKGDKYDIYADSYNAGDTVEIGEGGGDSKEDTWYYKSLRTNLYKDNEYILKLFVPKKENSVDDLMSDDNVKGVYKRDENGNLVEVSPESLKLEVNTTVKVNRLGNISVEKSSEDKVSLSAWILRGLVILIILFVIITKIKDKLFNKSFKSDSQTCKACDFENNSKANYCKNCGNRLDS